MSGPKSITVWINQLKAGDANAAQRLWEEYFQRMVELARRKLEGTTRAAADEEDVALSAFKSFCLGAREGRYTRLHDRDNLWPLLVAITAHKSVDFIRRENRQKRGGSGTNDDEATDAPALLAVPLSDIISREPTPEFAAEMTDHLQRLLTRLDETGDRELRRIALLRLEGYSPAEIAARTECARRTVERKLVLIGRLWGKAATE